FGQGTSLETAGAPSAAGPTAPSRSAERRATARPRRLCGWPRLAWRHGGGRLVRPDLTGRLRPAHADPVCAAGGDSAATSGRHDLGASGDGNLAVDHGNAMADMSGSILRPTRIV